MAARPKTSPLLRAIRALPLAVALLWPIQITAAAQASVSSAPPATTPRTLDDFDALAPWTAVSSDQVTARLYLAPGAGGGQALCMDFDFHGVSGYVGITRALPIDYPADYAFAFDWRGDAPANDLQFKLVDASGDNVWWVQRPKQPVPADWTHVRYKKRHVSKAWGPSPQTELTHSAKLEFTLASGAGGKGTVCFDHLRFTPLQPDDGSPLRATAGPGGGATAAAALDGRDDTIWHGSFAARPVLLMDLGRVREFGGLTLRWSAQHAADYDLALSDDAEDWRKVREVRGGNGGQDWLALPESEARYLRLTPLRGPRPTFGLLEARVEPLAFAATPNDFIKSVAAGSPRGNWPRGFSGEQPYWTIVGIDGGKNQGLIGEDGAIELGKGGPSIEPFVVVDGVRVDWAHVKASQSLEDGYLPIPSVAWRHPRFSLDITAFAAGAPGNSRLLGRYVLKNTTAAARDYEFDLALRPLQVNPPSQFLNTTGGVSPLRAAGASLDDGTAASTVAGSADWIVHLLRGADAVAGTTLDSGDLDAVPFGSWPEQRIDRVAVNDPAGLAGAVWRYRVRLAPGESTEFAWWSPLEGTGAFNPTGAQSAVAADWHRKLDVVRIDVPPQGRRLVDTLKTALANMLISRQGPRLQPGTRSYARAWIRDGAMINEALLRLGRGDVAREFVRWYAPYQFDDGKVPCCVDDRGSDPVPENDSQGELVYAIAEAYRYTQDRALLEQTWPNVRKAIAYMDQLRLGERTEANRAKNPAFYGMMPVSISHEGYSAKPMHSYWDDFWALRGYKDAVDIATWLGHDAEAKAFAASRDQFAGDLRASIVAAAKGKGIDFIPGAAELGDFDATSTTIALSPADAGDLLPADLLHNTFERYWRESRTRADGSRKWKDYTPYELRSVGAFVRLGQPDRAQAMLDFFFRHQQPAGWNQWAEVVSATPRKPFFLGDLPHAWVASDYVRSVLDMFAYVRGRDGAIVIGAGIPLDWLDGDGVAVDGLRTPRGPISFALKRDGTRITLDLKAGSVPPGGFVLQLPKADVREARIDGQRATWAGHELRVDRAPARVELRTGR